MATAPVLQNPDPATAYQQAYDALGNLYVTEETCVSMIDAQYNVGFTWERQYGFRVVHNFNDKFFAGMSVEAAQTLNIGGHNLPTVLDQQACASGGQYNPLANCSYN